MYNYSFTVNYKPFVYAIGLMLFTDGSPLPSYSKGIIILQERGGAYNAEFIVMDFPLVVFYTFISFGAIYSLPYPR